MLNNSVKIAILLKPDQIAADIVRVDLVLIRLAKNGTRDREIFKSHFISKSVDLQQEIALKKMFGCCISIMEFLFISGSKLLTL